MPAGEPGVSTMMMREDHRGRADDGRPDEHRLRGGLERVARRVVLLEVVLGPVEVEVEAEVLLHLLLDVGNGLDERELVHGLGVVGHRAVGVDGDGDRAHPQEAERHEAEGEDRRGEHQGAEAERGRRSRPPHIRPTITMPIQKALKLPATNPERMFSEAPPSREAVTISCT